MRLNITLISCIAALAAPLAIASPVTYSVTVDTSSLALPPPAQYGYIDMQFNPATTPGQQGATATVSNFLTDGSLNASDSNNFAQGSTTGSLAPLQSVVFQNSTSTNEYFEGLTFGTTISFDLTLDGSMIESANGSGGPTTFFLDFLNSSMSSYLLTNDPSGSTPLGFYVGYLTINPDGSVTTTENPSAGGGASAVTFTPLGSSGGSTSPEPSTWLLLSAGLSGFGLFARRRSRVEKA